MRRCARSWAFARLPLKAGRGIAPGLPATRILSLGGNPMSEHDPDLEADDLTPEEIQAIQESQAQPDTPDATDPEAG